MNTQTPQDVVDRYYLESRCMLIEVAATLDRFDRAVARSAGEPGALDAVRRHQIGRLRSALEILAKDDSAASADERCGPSSRAEELLLLFSDLD